jgi:hypothetical protein
VARISPRGDTATVATSRAAFHINQTVTHILLAGQIVPNSASYLPVCGLLDNGAPNGTEAVHFPTTPSHAL